MSAKNHRGEWQRDQLTARLERYKALRDEGMLPVDVARELGVTSDTTMRYERWYRALKGLPRRERGERHVPGEPRRFGDSVMWVTMSEPYLPRRSNSGKVETGTQAQAQAETEQESQAD